jgi:hypothetical protein
VFAATLVAACGNEENGSGRTNADDAVDPALVGFWEIPVPGGRWTLKIEPYGHYEFSNVSGSAAPSHMGSFAARNGEWTLRSVSGIEDRGSYKAVDGGVELTGNRGPVRWAPGTAITGVTPGADAAGSVAPLPGATGAGLQQQPAFGGAQPAQPARTAPALTDTRAAGTSAGASGGNIPDIVDPCLLVTAEEVGNLFGVPATTKRTTPQPRTQNDCFYSGAGGLSFTVTSFNGKGLDPAGYIQRREREGGVPIAAIGDRAVQTYRAATGLVSVDFVIGATSVSLLVAGVEPNRAQPAMIELARQAADRLTSMSSSYDMGGLERFVGAWRVVTHAKDSRADIPDAIIIVARNGDVTFETSAVSSGTLELEGNAWRLEKPYFQGLPQGTYRLRGNNLSLGGEVLDVNLERVACGKEPKVPPPYELGRTLGGQMLSTSRLRADLRPPESKTLDKNLIGLWDGEGKFVAFGVATRLLMTIDERGYAVLAFFPHTKGRLEARNGEYTLVLEGEPTRKGAYSFAGGVNDGIIRMQDGENTLEWIPTDPSKHPVFETPIVARSCG